MTALLYWERSRFEDFNRAFNCGEESFQGPFMNHINQLSREFAAVAVIDMQEAFRSVIPDFGEVASRIAKAVEGARLLEVPVIVTEQYPKGLKHTAEEILPHLVAEPKVVEKMCFSSCGAEDFH